MQGVFPRPRYRPGMNRRWMKRELDKRYAHVAIPEKARRVQVPPRSCEAVRILGFLFRAIRTAFEFEQAHGAGVVQQYVAHSSKAVCCSRLMHLGFARSGRCAPTAKPSAYKKLPVVTFSYGSTMAPFLYVAKSDGAPLGLLLEVFNLGDVDDAVKVFACVWWVVNRPRQLVP
jgi:hypothetical protein